MVIAPAFSPTLALGGVFLKKKQEKTRSDTTQEAPNTGTSPDMYPLITPSSLIRLDKLVPPSCRSCARPRRFCKLNKFSSRAKPAGSGARFCTQEPGRQQSCRPSLGQNRPRQLGGTTGSGERRQRRRLVPVGPDTRTRGEHHQGQLTLDTRQRRKPFQTPRRTSPGRHLGGR